MINENNAFATNMMSVCVDAVKIARNAVVLNDSSDDSCTVKDNLDQQCQYLTGNSK